MQRNLEAFELLISQKESIEPQILGFFSASDTKLKKKLVCVEHLPVQLFRQLKMFNLV